MKYSMKEFYVIIFQAVLISVIILSQTAFGHEEGAPFSGAIIDPLDVHHAHIEDEQRINFSFLDGFRDEEGEKRTAYSTSLELAVDWTGKFRLGSEVVIPFSNTGSDRNVYNIGDIELWPIKYAFIKKPETILTGVLSFGLPTGDESKGLGEGNTTAGALILIDHAYRNWFFGFNMEIETNLSNKAGSEFEVASVISYSFIKETGNGMAPSRPHQAIVPSLSLEIISKSGLSGEEKGEDPVNVIGGFTLWHTKSGWTGRIGVDVPMRSDRESDLSVLFQIGNHISWGKLFR